MRRHEPGCGCGWPDYAHTILEALEYLGEAMTEISSDQAHLDADVQALADAVTGVEAEIAALKNQPAAAALDFTALDGVVSRLKSDVPAPAPTPAPAPADPAPVPTPSPAPTPAAATLYTYAGNASVDAAVWRDSGQRTPDGAPLYTYAGDTNPGDQLGAGAEWQIYTPPAA